MEVMKLRAVVKYTGDKTLVTPDLHKRMRHTKHDVLGSLKLLEELYGPTSRPESEFSLRRKSNDENNNNNHNNHNNNNDGCGTINVIKFCINIHENIIREADLLLSTL